MLNSGVQLTNEFGNYQTNKYIANYIEEFPEADFKVDIECSSESECITSIYTAMSVAVITLIDSVKDKDEQMTFQLTVNK